MYNFYLTKDGNILNVEMGCFQAPDGRYLRPVLQDELYHLCDVLIPVEFPEGLECPDFSKFEEFVIKINEFEPILRWMQMSNIYKTLTDSDLVFKRSNNHKDLISFICNSQPNEFCIGEDDNIYIYLKGLHFYIVKGIVHTLQNPFMHHKNLEFKITKKIIKRKK